MLGLDGRGRPSPHEPSCPNARSFSRKRYGNATVVFGEAGFGELEFQLR